MLEILWIGIFASCVVAIYWSFVGAIEYMQKDKKELSDYDSLKSQNVDLIAELEWAIEQNERDKLKEYLASVISLAETAYLEGWGHSAIYHGAEKSIDRILGIAKDDYEFNSKTRTEIEKFKDLLK